MRSPVRYYHLINPAGTLALLLLICSCTKVSTPPVSENTPVKTDRPTPVDIRVDPESHALSISWSMVSEAGVAGYDIYLEEVTGDGSSMKAIGTEHRPHNSDPFPGDTDPDDPREHYLATGLQNRVRYLVSVIAVYSDGSKQPYRLPSNLEGALIEVPRPSSQFTLPIRGRGESDGFCFECERAVAARDTLNDLYFFSKDGMDYLNAPSRQEGLLKSNTLMNLPFRGTFAQVRQKRNEFIGRAGGDRILVKEGDWILVQSPTHLYTLVQVISLSGEGDARRITCRYFAASRLDVCRF